MGGFEIGHAGALLAGILSFLSPCVLPLVPPYLCFLGGITFEQLDQPGVARRVPAMALAFVLGFTVVFVAMGATASAVGRLLAEHMTLLGQIAGVVIIVLGLHFLGVFRLMPLLREARFQPERHPTGLFGAFLVGLAFAFGWTPCVGPALAAILFVAGSGAGRSTVPRCWRPTRSGSASRSSRRRSRSAHSWASCAVSAGTCTGSSRPWEPCSSRRACCSSRAR